MPVSLEEVQTLCEGLGLPFEAKDNGVAVSYLPFSEAEDRAAYGTLVIRFLDEGRLLRLSSDLLFSAANIAQQHKRMSGLMAELFVQDVKNPLGSVGISERFDFFYFQTIPFEDSSLTSEQFKSMLRGMMEGIRSTILVAQQYMQGVASDEDEELTPEQGLQQDLARAEMALKVMEQRLGTNEQQESAWDFINDLLKPGRLPENYQVSLQKLVAPIIALESNDRPVW